MPEQTEPRKLKPGDDLPGLGECLKMDECPIQIYKASGANKLVVDDLPYKLDGGPTVQDYEFAERPLRGLAGERVLTILNSIYNKARIRVAHVDPNATGVLADDSCKDHYSKPEDKNFFYMTKGHPLRQYLHRKPLQILLQITWNESASGLEAPDHGLGFQRVVQNGTLVIEITEEGTYTFTPSGLAWDHPGAAPHACGQPPLFSFEVQVEVEVDSEQNVVVTSTAWIRGPEGETKRGPLENVGLYQFWSPTYLCRPLPIPEASGGSLVVRYGHTFADMVEMLAEISQIVRDANPQIDWAALDAQMGIT